MEPTTSPTNYQPGVPTPQLLTLLNIGIALTLLGSITLIVLILFGYGTVNINIPSGTSLHINGHAVTARTLKIRPGSYAVSLASPTTNPSETTLQVSLFQTITFNPKLQPRDPNAIVSSLIGASGESGVPRIGQVKWFQDNTWLVGTIVPGGSRIAVQYDHAKQQWIIGFYDTAGYPQDQSKLPTDVATYLNSIGKQDV